jgi:hypothetical protein
MSLRSIEARAARSARRPRAEVEGWARSVEPAPDLIDLIASACTPRYQVFGAYKSSEKAGAQSWFLDLILFGRRCCSLEPLFL